MFICLYVCVFFMKIFFRFSEDIGDVIYCNLCDGRRIFSIDLLKNIEFFCFIVWKFE